MLQRDSILSGNSIDAEYYSDGKVVAPMLMNFPDFTKCGKCHHLFQLSKLKHIGLQDREADTNPEWKYVAYAKFLSLDDCFCVLHQGLALGRDDELQVRKRIWWLFNDRVRFVLHVFDLSNEHGDIYEQGKGLFIRETDESLWSSNLKSLLNLLDYNVIEERILIAEITRNFGDIIGCLKILYTIEDQKYNWVVDNFERECFKMNKSVFQLQM